MTGKSGEKWALYTCVTIWDELNIPRRLAVLPKLGSI
jgi:hypothetical protein